MRAELDEADVVRNAAIIFSPCFEHTLRVLYGFDLSENPPVSVVDE